MAIAATFTAEPLLQPLEWLLDEAGVHPSLHLAPYHQLFQQLLSPGSLLASHVGAANVVLVRVEDFVREVLEPATALSLIERSSRELWAALLQFASHSRSPLLVLLLPASVRGAQPLAKALQATTARLHEQLSSCHALQLIDVAQIDARCGSDRHDRLRDELAHIPYTDEYFAAMALVLAQRIQPAPAPASGKAVLETLRSRRRRTRPLRERAVQPASATEQELLTLWQELLNIEQLGVEDNYFALGGTSVLVARMFADMARRFGVRLPPASIVAAPTVRALARELQSLQQARTQQAASLLVELKLGGPRNFFLVHDGDGGTALYRHLAQHLPSALSVYGIEPHRLPRVPLAAGSIAQMAHDYVAQVRRLQPHGPYQLGGLSAGALIAYEMGRQLQAAGEHVATLALLDAARPGAAKRPGYIARQRLLRLWVRLRIALLRRGLAQGRAWPARLCALDVRQRYESAEAGYLPQPLIGAGVVLLRARAGLDGTNDTPARLIYMDEALGWRAVVPELEILDVEGGHASMLREPHVAGLAALLADRLLPQVQQERATAGSGAR